MVTQSKFRSTIAATATALVIAAGFAGAALAQESPLGGITHCSAPGGQQTTGALLGAVLGAVAGNGLSKGDRTAGTALGAIVGGAAGSWMGCKVQRDRADAQYAGYTVAREDLVRHPAAYRRAIVEQRRRDRESADRAYRESRYQDRYAARYDAYRPSHTAYAPSDTGYDAYGY
jgi:phage tail tape-measure protein